MIFLRTLPGIGLRDLAETSDSLGILRSMYRKKKFQFLPSSLHFCTGRYRAWTGGDVRRSLVILAQSLHLKLKFCEQKVLFLCWKSRESSLADCMRSQFIPVPP